MQKATYYDSSAIYTGYPYQSANGFGYDANQVQYPRASHVESEYHRPACSLQSPGGSVALHEPGEMAEGCDRSAAIRAAPSEVHSEGNQPQAPPAAPHSPGAVSQNGGGGGGGGGGPPPHPTHPHHQHQQPQQPGAAKSGSPTSGPARGKQIFPWMKESRQNTKQKPASSTNSGTCTHTHARTESEVLLREDTVHKGVCVSEGRQKHKTLKHPHQGSQGCSISDVSRLCSLFGLKFTCHVCRRRSQQRVSTPQ